MTFSLSGRIQAEDLAELKRVMESYSKPASKDSGERPVTSQKKQLFKWTAAALVLGAAAIFLWQRYFVKRDEGLASGDGRIEAPEIDVAAKIPGPDPGDLVHEGDFVMAGQVVVLMDTDSLNAQRREADAQHQSAARAQQLEISGHPLRES